MVFQEYLLPFVHLHLWQLKHVPSKQDSKSVYLSWQSMGTEDPHVVSSNPDVLGSFLPIPLDKQLSETH